MLSASSKASTLSSPSASNLGRIANPGVGRFELVFILMIFGLLAGANGFRLSFNSALPCSLLALTLIAVRLTRADRLPLLTLYSMTLAVALGVWFMGAAVSAIYHVSERTLEHFLAGYFIPLLIYAGLAHRPMTEPQKRLVLVAIAAGAMIPWVWGIIAYLNSFGFPSAVELLWNRYDRPRMDPYQRVAFGNTSHMAQYLAVVLPPLLYMAASKSTPMLARTVFGIACLAGIANLLLIVSRGATLTLLVLVVFWFAVSRSMRLGIAACALGAALGWLMGDMDEATALLAERTVDTVGGGDVVDQSMAMRIDSIVVGWRLFAEHPFVGVGPGLTYRFNEWSIAHQMAVEEAASIGIGGLVAIVLLTILVAIRSFRIATRQLVMSPSDLALWSGILGWITYTTTAGGLLNLGLLIPWAGLLYGFLALTADQPPKGWGPNP